MALSGLATNLHARGRSKLNLLMAQNRAYRALMPTPYEHYIYLKGLVIALFLN
jgi:hypothetical protein